MRVCRPIRLGLVFLLAAATIPSISTALVQEEVAQFGMITAAEMVDEMTDERTRRLILPTSLNDRPFAQIQFLHAQPVVWELDRVLKMFVFTSISEERPVDSTHARMRVDDNPFIDVEGMVRKGHLHIFINSAEAEQILTEMKTGKELKMQLSQGGESVIWKFDLAELTPALAWLEEGEQLRRAAEAELEASRPKVEKTELPLRLEAKDGSGWVDFRLVSDRVRIMLTRRNDILDYRVDMSVDGRRIEEYRASKGFDERYTGATVMFTPMFEERDAIQKGEEMCLTVRSVTTGPRRMCFDVSKIVFH